MKNRDAFKQGIEAERARILAILRDQDCGDNGCRECATLEWVMKEIERTK